MALYDHIQELRAELSRCDDMGEIAKIEHDLRAAEAEYAEIEKEFAAWFASQE